MELIQFKADKAMEIRIYKLMQLQNIETVSEMMRIITQYYIDEAMRGGADLSIGSDVVLIDERAWKERL